MLGDMQELSSKLYITTEVSQACLIKLTPILDSNFRHRLVLTWYISKDLVCPDYDNLWIVEKVLLDVMVKDLKVLKDDKHTYMKGGSKDYEYRETEGFKIEIWKTN